MNSLTLSMKKAMPKNFDEDCKDIVCRIESNPNVVGVIYFEHDELKFSTLPENLTQNFQVKIPPLSTAFRHAISEITDMINTINPMVDRIMDDDTVEGVVMTNNEGAPLLTNMNKIGANAGGHELSTLGALASLFIKEMDIFDEILVMRLSTKKVEIMISPNREFNIIVFQRARIKKPEDVKAPPKPK